MFTYEEVLGDLREIVQQEGEDKVADCCYVDWDGYAQELSPTCIVGHFLWKHDLIDYDEWDIIDGQNSDYVVERLEKRKNVGFETEAKKLLLLVQESQDTGVPWGYALENAVVQLAEEG